MNFACAQNAGNGFFVCWGGGGGSGIPQYSKPSDDFAAFWCLFSTSSVLFFKLSLGPDMCIPQRCFSTSFTMENNISDFLLAFLGRIVVSS